MAEYHVLLVRDPRSPQTLTVTNRSSARVVRTFTLRDGDQLSPNSFEIIMAEKVPGGNRWPLKLGIPNGGGFKATPLPGSITPRKGVLTLADFKELSARVSILGDHFSLTFDRTDFDLSTGENRFFLGFNYGDVASAKKYLIGRDHATGRAELGRLQALRHQEQTVVIHRDTLLFAAETEAEMKQILLFFGQSIEEEELAYHVRGDSFRSFVSLQFVDDAESRSLVDAFLALDPELDREAIRDLKWSIQQLADPETPFLSDQIDDWLQENYGLSEGEAD